MLEGPERRRRWSAEEKARIVAESLEPDAVASTVVRRHGMHRNQLYGKRCASPTGVTVDGSVGTAAAFVFLA
ncbi:transposase [Nitrospirillum iridis]|uniref:transposase n=1 Tax=Nitrospirillum iridis TaxID=765888 RepID=UPI003CCE263F